MDFEGFNGGAAAHKAKPGSAQKATFPEFTNADGSALELMLIPGVTPEGEKEMRKWRLKYAGVMVDHFETDDAQLEMLSERDKKAGPELTARLVKSWNVKDKAGKKVEDSLDNKTAFFAAFPEVRDAVMSTLNELTKKLEKPKAS